MPSPGSSISLLQLAQTLPQDLTASSAEAWSLDAAISGIALDSRQVQPGDLFIALVGGNTDGHRYIPAALQRGAAAVVGTQPLSDLPVPYLQVTDGRLALAYLSAAFFSFPARRLAMIGVTGTDGKTTTCNLIYHILQAAGLRTGMISTVNARIGDEVLDTGFHVTTPEAPDVQRYLARMLAAGLTHAVLEATSHGLAQHRLAACDFDLAVITNITHEHLDYHGSYPAYRAAKASLFSGLAGTPSKPLGNYRAAILNRDDSSYAYLSDQLQPLPTIRAISYGLHPQADLRAEQIRHTPSGLRFVAVSRDLHLPVESPLVGDYNVSNCLAAIAATVIGMDLDGEAALQGIAALRGIPGRMETLDLGQDFLAIVDFAHTPNALRRALIAARQMASGQVIAIFGSAGLRDRAKRRMMAETSLELADISVFTAEDPRTESLDDILTEMAAGAQAHGGVEGQDFWRIPDRREALRFAVSQALPGDLVIALGKGHEQSMCFGETEYPWDDRIALRAALREHLGIPGPAMPYLPSPDSYLP